ncbi:hypothetical protein ACJJTC_003478 [Scirpophaga incertulas]
MKSVETILDAVKKCYLPILSRNLEELEHHGEFDEWQKNLTLYFPNLFVLINDINFKECRMSSTVLSSLLVLHYELLSEGPWKTKKCNECLTKMNHQFNLINNTTLYNLLISKVYNTQEIFDKTMETLHAILSVDEFKKYPALIEVYCLIIKDLKEYDIELKPRSVIPLSLLLIDDYVTDNKIKGLQCCSIILDCLTTTMDDAFRLIIDQTYTETNLYKKKVYFGFLNKLIPEHGIYCIKRKMFLTLISDNLDMCSNKVVAPILLSDTLECLISWIQNCWCAWRLLPNQKVLSTLIKLLYIYCDDDKLCNKMKNICITLIQLSSIDEQQQIYKSMTNTVENVNNLNPRFIAKLNNIRNELCDCVKE